MTPSQAFELSRLGPAGQRSLFSILSAGRCDTYAKLRATADGLLAAESQSALFDLPVPTREEAAALSAFERKLEQLTKLIGSGFQDNEIVVLKKINAARAANVVVEVDLMARHLAMLQRELQKSAAQAELLKQSG